jgi:hypothetical protein
MSSAKAEDLLCGPSGILAIHLHGKNLSSVRLLFV